MGIDKLLQEIWKKNQFIYKEMRRGKVDRSGWNKLLVKKMWAVEIVKLWIGDLVGATKPVYPKICNMSGEAYHRVDITY